jgi:hypothetical protein
MKAYMTHVKLALVVVGLVGGGATLSADILPRETWKQLPDLSTNGLDILATFNAGTVKPTRNVLLADQFVSGYSGALTGIHLWGSWLNNVVDPSVKFSVSVLANNITSVTNNKPGAVLWTGTFAPTTSSLYATTPSQMFWNPSTGSTMAGGNTQTFQYDFVNPVNSKGLAFEQVAGTTYWLSIQASTANGQLFGWSTRDWLEGPHTGSPAVYGTNTSLGSTRITFKDMLYPAGVDPRLVGQPIDLAFALETPEPTASAVLVFGLVALLWRRKAVV